MAKEYIEKETLIKYLRDKQVALENIDCINMAKDIGRITRHIEQDKIPTADVVEAKHGYWDLLEDCANAGVYCSVCNKKVYKEHYANVKKKSKFCPNCGAIMDVKI